MRVAAQYGGPTPERLAWRLRLLLALILIALAVPATAQIRTPRERPDLPEPPEVEEPEPPPELELPPAEPPLEIPEEPPRGPLLFVSAYRFEGNTAFSDEELAELAAPYANREVGSADIETLRQAVTHLYVEAGYINSGAVIPDQDPSEGVIEIQLIEGHLEEIVVRGNKYFRTRFLQRRIELGAGPPLNVKSLEKRLQILQQDSRIRRVNAELGPGPRRGEAILRVRIEEVRPYKLWMEASNHEVPSIGPWRGRFRGTHENVTGHGDMLTTMFTVTGGYWELEALGSIPVTPWDTELRAWYRRGDSDVTEEPFDDLDIESELREYAVGIQQPLVRTLNHTLTVGLNLEIRRSKTYLLNEPFSFAPGVQDGVSKVVPLRFFQEWVYRDPLQVLAARSQLSFGLDVFDSTRNRGRTPDGKFTSWLGQFQWVRRLPWWGVESTFRIDAQLSNKALLPLEQMAIGGPLSVRGYRKNAIVRDNGLDASLELRIPVLHRKDGRPMVQLAPFIDYGRSFWRDRPPETILSRSETLWGAGIGLRWAIMDHADFEGYWGRNLREVETRQEYDLQDISLYFRLVVRI